MFQRKPRRFRRRTNGRNQALHSNRNVKTALRSNSFSNNHGRNNFRSFLSAEKLFEKYNSLAKEAMSSGDKILSENYLQHADHFKRVIEDKNKNRNQVKDNAVNKPIESDKNLLEEDVTDQSNKIKS